MRRFDCNCFTGNWPFHYIRANTPEKLAALHARAGITGGLVSAFEGIFFQDPWEADSRLAEALAGTNYLQAQTINPLHPGWEGMLLRGVKAGVKAVRIYPGFHDYLLDSPALAELCDALREYRLPLVLSLRLEDSRITYMYHPKAVDPNYVSYFLSAQRGIPTLITNIERGEISFLQDQMAERGDVYIDTAGMRSGAFAVEKAVKAGYAPYLVYGSTAPLFELMSTVCTVDMDPCAQEVKDRIFDGHGFADALMRG